MRRTETVLAVCACLFVLSCGAPEAGRSTQDTDAPINVPPLESFGGIGGDFVLVDQQGDRFELNQLRGRPVVLFYGYTYCPDICPVTLSKMSEVHELLHTGAQDLATVFITVDPERDTGARLSQYLGYFGGGVIGLRGNAEEIDKVIGQYGGHYALNKDPGQVDYFVDHSTSTYLIDQEGKVRFLFGQSDGPELMAAVIRQLLPDTR